MRRNILLTCSILLTAGCGTSGTPTEIHLTSESLYAESANQIPAQNPEVFETKEKPTGGEQSTLAPICPAVVHIEDLGRYWAEGVSENMRNSTLHQYEVPVNESNLSAIKEALNVFDKQFEYVEKMLFKDYLLEFYGLKDEILNSNYSDRYPDKIRKLATKFFRETEEAYLQAGVAMNAFVIRHEIEPRLKEMYLSDESISLEEVNVIYNVLNHLRDSIRFFEQRHERVHELIAANKQFQIRDKGKAVPLLVEEHAYWAVADYSADPDIDMYLYKPKKRKIDRNKFNYGPRFFPHPEAIETVGITGDGSDFIYLRMKFPKETSGMLLRGEAPREPAIYGNDADKKEVDWSKSTALSHTKINRRILRWARKRGIEGPYVAHYPFKFEAVASRWVIDHKRTLQFLQREGGAMIGEDENESLDFGIETIVRSGVGPQATPERNDVLPFSKELVMYELLHQAPNVRKSDYLPEFDETIKLFEDWIANKGDR